MAAGVDDLSGGRLILGMGAGWQDREHHNFGIPFYDKATRFDMLWDGLEVVTRLLRSDQPVSYQGKYFSLDGAILLPRPQRRTPILIGGKGPQRTMPLVAQYADEWNGVLMPLDLYKDRAALLDDLLREHGRQPGDVKRSLMTQIVFGKDDAALNARLAAKGANQDIDELISSGMIVGTSSAIIDQIGKWSEAGVERFMLQWLDLDDIELLEIIARDVLPHFHQ